MEIKRFFGHIVVFLKRNEKHNWARGNERMPVLSSFVTKGYFGADAVHTEKVIPVFSEIVCIKNPLF